MTTTTELAGKVALVTGASRNIGRAIALALAADGAAVAVNTRSSKEDADKVVQEIRQAGGQAETFMADIVDAKAVNAMVDGVVKRFGRLDILVLNASVRKETAFMEMGFDEWRSLLSITLDGSFQVRRRGQQSPECLTTGLRRELIQRLKNRVFHDVDRGHVGVL